VSAGLIRRNSEPQPKARPDDPGPGTGLLPGDGPAESPRHPLQERVKEGGGREIEMEMRGSLQSCLSITSKPKN